MSDGGPSGWPDNNGVVIHTRDDVHVYDMCEVLGGS